MPEAGTCRVWWIFFYAPTGYLRRKRDPSPTELGARGASSRGVWRRGRTPGEKREREKIRNLYLRVRAVIQRPRQSLRAHCEHFRESARLFRENRESEKRVRGTRARGTRDGVTPVAQLRSISAVPRTNNAISPRITALNTHGPSPRAPERAREGHRYPASYPRVSPA